MDMRTIEREIRKAYEEHTLTRVMKALLRPFAWLKLVLVTSFFMALFGAYTYLLFTRSIPPLYQALRYALQ